MVMRFHSNLIKHGPNLKLDLGFSQKRSQNALKFRRNIMHVYKQYGHTQGNINIQDLIAFRILKQLIALLKYRKSYITYL